MKKLSSNDYSWKSDEFSIELGKMLFGGENICLLLTLLVRVNILIMVIMIVINGNKNGGQ